MLVRCHQDTTAAPADCRPSDWPEGLCTRLRLLESLTVVRQQIWLT